MFTSFSLTSSTALVQVSQCCLLSVLYQAPHNAEGVHRLRKAPVEVRILNALEVTHPELLFSVPEVQRLKDYAVFREQWRAECSSALVSLGPGASTSRAWQRTLELHKLRFDKYLLDYPEVGQLLSRLRSRRCGAILYALLGTLLAWMREDSVSA